MESDQTLIRRVDARLKNVERLLMALHRDRHRAFHALPDNVTPPFDHSTHDLTVSPEISSHQPSAEQDHADPERAISQCVYVEQLFNGVLHDPELVPLKDVRSLRTGKHWSILINEPKDRLIMLGDQEIRRMRISRLPKLPKTFLWLVLTNVKSGLSFECIAEQFSYAANRADSRDNCIHRQKNRLKEVILGCLASKVFGACRDKMYPISRGGWSYFWIRKVKDPKESELVQRGRGCPTENQ